METSKTPADRPESSTASAPVSPKSAAAAGRKTPEMDAAAPSVSTAVCTTSRSRKRRAVDELEVDLVRVLKLIRKPAAGGQSPLEQLEKQVCCRFEVEQANWNRYVISMTGTDVGLRKGRSKITEMTDGNEAEAKKRREVGALDEFPFMRLPVEIQEMILARVDTEDERFQRQDGRALLPLRLVDGHFKRLADQLLAKGFQRCFKQRIFVGEALNGTVRLGFPPLTSTVTVTFEQLDDIFQKITCTPPSVGMSKAFTEIGLKCDYRPSWCKQMMDLLLKHQHIQPDCLIVRGVLCDKQTFQKYVNDRPSLQALIFEKPLGKTAVYEGAAYMPHFKSKFKDLGPQFDAPQNVRKNYNIRFVYSRKRRPFDFVQQLLF